MLKPHFLYSLLKYFLFQLLERNPKSTKLLQKRRLSDIVRLKKHNTGYGSIAPSSSSVILVDLSDEDVDFQKAV